MISITGDTIEGAWMAALNSLLDDELAPGGKAAHLAVAFPAHATDEGVRGTVDRFLSGAAQRKPSAGLASIDTVANTLFPSAFYLPGRAEAPRQHLYDMHEARMKFHRRGRAREKETYFSRMTGTDGTGERGPNQLEALVTRVQHERTLPGPKSSAYEIGLTDLVGPLRVRSPERDRSVMGCPCLSPVSVTLVRGVVHLTAQYRNQHFIRKALGNYVGLARLCDFSAIEVGAAPGEVLCVAAHADAELNMGIGGRGGYRRLLEDCSGAPESGAESGTRADVA